MKRTILACLALAASACLAPTAWSLCPETPSYGDRIFVGVDLTRPTRGQLPGLPDVADLDLLRVQLVWVPDDAPARYRDMYMIDIDWRARTHTNVDVWDGELRAIRERGVIAVELAENTDFDRGQLHLLTCNDYYTNAASPVVAFAYYGHDGEIAPGELGTMVTYVVGNYLGQNYATAVFNEVTSTQLYDVFNDDLAPRMVEDVAHATGVVPGRFLAESLLFQNLNVVSRLFAFSPPLVFDGRGALVHHNLVYVTGEGASAAVPLSIGAVLRDGVNVMDADHRVRDLGELAGGTLSFEPAWEDYYGFRGTRWNHPVIEARPDLDVELGECIGGHATLRAAFRHRSRLRGAISLFDTLGFDVRFPIATGSESIELELDCDKDYRLTSRRVDEGAPELPTGQHPVPLASR